LNFIETVAFVEFLCINKKNLAVSVGHPPDPAKKPQELA
jgi:hypothetical protein